jgi:hypothetical protein
MKKIDPLIFRCLNLSILFLLISSCKEETVFLKNKTDQFAVTIDYENETLTLIGGTNTEFQKDPSSILTSEPKLDRSHFKIGIFSDGNCEIEITIQEPKNPFRIPFEVLPDPNPKLHKMKLSGGFAYSFDKSGCLLSKMPTEMPSFYDFLQVLKKNNNHLNRNIYATYFANYEKKNTQGSAETHRYDGKFRIIESILGPEDGANSLFIGKKVTTWFDIETNDLRGQAISDDSENVKYMIQFGYDENTESIFPSFTKEESYETTANGENYVITTYSDFENVDIEINL